MWYMATPLILFYSLEPSIPYEWKVLIFWADNDVFLDLEKISFQCPGIIIN